MANLWNKISDFLGFGVEEDELLEEEVTEKERPLNTLTRPLPEPVADGGNVMALPESRVGRAARRGRPVALVPAPALRVVGIQPRDLNDARTAADHLRSGHPVIANMEGVEKDEALKVLYFLNGVVYTLNGTARRLTTHFFIFAPEGVDIELLGTNWPELERIDWLGEKKAGKAIPK